MALSEMNYVDGGDGSKVAFGYVASDLSNPITTNDIVTGQSFQPKKLIWVAQYSTNDTMSGIYDEDTSSSSYTRYYQGTSSLSLPQTTSIGLGSITATGFTMYNVSNLSKLYYMAIG